MTKKTWTEKLHNSKDLPKVKKLEPKAAGHWGGKTMIIPSPLEVNKIMKKIPRRLEPTKEIIRTRRS